MNWRCFNSACKSETGSLSGEKPLSEDIEAASPATSPLIAAACMTRKTDQAASFAPMQRPAVRSPLTFLGNNARYGSYHTSSPFFHSATSPTQSSKCLNASPLPSVYCDSMRRVVRKSAIAGREPGKILARPFGPSLACSSL